MKLRTSLFNRTVFTNTLQRYWLVFVGYLGAVSCFTLIPLINALQEAGWYPTSLPYYASLLQLLSECLQPVIVVNFIAVAVVAALLFSYLYNARHTGMMASLPVKRETMYLSVSAAAIVGMTLCNVIVVLLALVIEVIYGQVHLLALGILLLVSVLSVIAFFGMAAFCCMLTGNIVAGPAVYLIFNFLSVGVEMIVSGILQTIVFGMGYRNTPKSIFLSPILQVGNSVQFTYEQIYDAANTWIDYTWEMHGLGILAIYMVVGLVFLVLGMFLYKNRRMETAGDTISIEILKPVFRFCMTIGGGLLFATFISNVLYEITPTKAMAAAYIAVLLIIGGVLGYFISQMLITKTVNVFRKGWKTVSLYAVVVILLMTAVETDLFGYEKFVPNKDDVASVRITGYASNPITLDEAENIETVIMLHQNIIANKFLHETEYGSPEAVAYINRFDDPAAALQNTFVNITYTLKDEQQISRRYRIVYGPDEIRNTQSEIRVFEALQNTAEGIEKRYTVDYPITIDNVGSGWVEYRDAVNYESFHYSDFSPSELLRLYNECILPDIADGKLGVVDIIEDKDYALSKYNCTIGLEFYREITTTRYGGRSFNEYKSIQIYPTLEASRTMAFLKEYGIEPAVVYDAKVAEGCDYNDLGVYYTDGEPMYQYGVDGIGIVPRESTSSAIIGGADGPTAIVITD
ncbi:MAG: hypothetical protein IIV43_03580 [Oscillospiraceae bacterium]|nr:hypothetical protein [Oscillospiraceae bacterium]